MNIQELATQARNSLSTYCIEECKAYCCRKGYLILTEEELNLLTGDKRAELEEKEFIKKQEDGSFSLNLGNHLNACPQLHENKCSIHKHPQRPQTCERFPIFINKGKEIQLSPRCPGIKENKLYSYVHEFLALGFKVNNK